MRRSVRYLAVPVLVAIVVACMSPVGVHAWGVQGHRLVALLATLINQSLSRRLQIFRSPRMCRR